MLNRARLRILKKINFPKTLWYNFRYLKLKDAIKLPILIGEGGKNQQIGSYKIHVSDKTESPFIGSFQCIHR